MVSFGYHTRCMEEINLNQRKVLPISKQPAIRCFSHHANLCSICESYITDGDKIADIDIFDADTKNEWCITAPNSIAKFDENNLKVYNDKYDDKMQCILYRDCHQEDELVIRINFQQYTSAWAAISIVIDHEPFSTENDKKVNFEFGNYSKKGLFIFLGDVEKTIEHEIKDCYPIYLKLKKSTNHLIASSSVNQADWTEQGSYSVEEIADRKLYIGINVNMNQYQWYNWYFTNYIQLKCNPNSGNVHADHYCSLSKNYTYHNLNMFLDYNVLDKQLILDYFGSIREYVKSSVDRNNYIELMLNEFYLPGTKSYQKIDRDHVNMIYGYDNSTGIFMTMGIEANGLIRFKDFTYSDIEEAIDHCNQSYDIIAIKYNPDSHLFELNIDFIVKFIKDYLNGYNSSKDCASLVPATMENFGVKIYAVYLNQEYYNIFLSDRRISFIIYEHKAIMYERIKFLMKRGILNEYDGLNLLSFSKELVNISSNIMMYVIKYSIKVDENISLRIITLMNELQSKETVMMKLLLDLLEDYIKRNREYGIS